MNKLRWLVLGIPVLLILLLILLNLYLLRSIKIVNTFQGKDIKVSRFLTAMYISKYHYYNNFRTLDLVFTDQPQSRMKLIDGNTGKLVSNVGINIENGTLSIKAFYDPETIDQVISEKGWVDYDLYRYICMSVDDQTLSFQGCNEQAKNYYDSTESSFIFRVFEDIFQFINGIAVKEVSAQCSGTLKCGVWAQVCSCSQPGYSCTSAGSACGTSGTCNCSYGCDEDAYTSISCSGMTESNCRIATAPVWCSNGGECPIDQMCTWGTGGVPVPTSAPCGCGTQECQDVWGCECTYYGCKLSYNGENCIERTCNNDPDPTPTPVCPSVTADISSSASPVNMCSGYTISWTSTNATGCTVSGSGMGTGVTGSLSQSKTTPGTYTYNLSCANTCGNTASDSVSVTVNSMTASISTTPVSPYMCQNYTVSWSSTGGANSCTVSGAGSATGGGSGSFIDFENTPGSYTYNISCTNSACPAASPATASVTANVQNISCAITSLTTSPSLAGIRVGESVIATAATSVSPAGAPAVDRVSFQVPPSGTSIARVCNAATPGLCGVSEDNEYTDTIPSPFSANVSIVNSNYLTATLQARGYIGACLPVERYCDATLSTGIAIDYKMGWFQVRGGNVVSRTGNVQSLIPATVTDANAATLDDRYFIKDPVALLIYSLSGAYDFDPDTTSVGRISTTDISASTNQSYRPDSSFDLYFNKRLPDDVRSSMTTILPSTIASTTLSSCTKVRNYRVCYYNGSTTGNLQLTGDYSIADGDRIILFVENAKTIINGKIKPLNRGRSSFLLISEGNIEIDPSVGGSPDSETDLEGLFYTDGTFDSGSWR